MNEQPSYFTKLMGLPCTGKPGVHIVRIEHDDWCAQLANGGDCNCNPSVWCASCGYKPIEQHGEKQQC